MFASEGALLESRGHRVLRYTLHNDQVDGMGNLALAGATVWNREVYKKLRALIRRERPQVAHFHNTFPLVSPAAYYAARAEGVPVVQTLHNYRLLCPDALFFREGRVCEDCLDKAVPWPGVVHSCYRGSRLASGGVAAMLTAHRALGTWKKVVDAYVALTEFAREKFVQGGLPPGKLVVKPNFLHTDPGTGIGDGGYALFVGRLSQEKGLGVLFSAWRRIGERMPLKVVGDGPMADAMSSFSARSAGVEWLGRRPADQVLALMKSARVLVFPSTWYEGFPMVIAEAYATGLPVISSDLGSMSSLVIHGRTGLRFRPGDPGDLVAQVERTLSNQEELARMRTGAREEFESKYTAGRNYQLLLGVYDRASGRA